jgi:regulator of replication initiation timing
MDQANDEIAHLSAKLACAEEESAMLTQRCKAQGEAYQEELARMLAKIGQAEEEIARREKQLEGIAKEQGRMIQEIGILHMENRQLKEVLMQLQHENAALKAHFEHAQSATATATADEPRIMSRIVPHDKKGVEASRKPGL